MGKGDGFKLAILLPTHKQPWETRGCEGAGAEEGLVI